MAKRLSLEIPPDLRPEEWDTVIRVLNERLLRIAEELGKAGAAFAISGDLDLKNFRIINLADPRDGQDAMTLRFAETRYQRKALGVTALAATPAPAPVNQQIVLTAPGTLAVQSDIAPQVSFPSDRTVDSIVAEVKQAPVGAALAANVLFGTTLYASATIGDGTTSVTVDASKLAGYKANTNVRVDLTGAGTTFPGSDLTVMVRFKP